MQILEITDKSFAPYGRRVEGAACTELLRVLRATPQPEGVKYIPEDADLQALPEAQTLGVALYGGMPVQFGWCNGHNTKLNCLEYHRNSEFNLGTEDFILMLARQDEIENGVLDTAKVKAFRVPAGVLVEVYATTLHYAPCHTDAQKGFRVMVALPKGTNTPKPVLNSTAGDAACLWAQNKWLLAHPESPNAARGAYLGLQGENIDLADCLPL